MPKLFFLVNVTSEEKGLSNSTADKFPGTAEGVTLFGVNCFRLETRKC